MVSPQTNDTQEPLINNASAAQSSNQSCSRSNTCYQKYSEKFLAQGLARAAGMKKREAKDLVHRALEGDADAQKTIAAARRSADETRFTEDISKGSRCRPSVFMAFTALTAAPGALVGGLVGGAAGTLACNPKKGACIGGAALGAVTAIPGAIVGGILQLPVTGARKAGEAMGCLQPIVMRGVKSPEMLQLLQLLGEGELDKMSEVKREMMTQMWSSKSCGGCPFSRCSSSNKCGSQSSAQQTSNAEYSKLPLQGSVAKHDETLKA